MFKHTTTIDKVTKQCVICGEVPVFTEYCPHNCVDGDVIIGAVVMFNGVSTRYDIPIDADPKAWVKKWVQVPDGGTLHWVLAPL
jgi:hypothetical protein